MQWIIHLAKSHGIQERVVDMFIIHLKTAWYFAPNRSFRKFKILPINSGSDLHGWAFGAFQFLLKKLMFSLRLQTKIIFSRKRRVS